MVVGWLLLRQAEVASAALASGTASARDQRFYEGKVAAASFFARTVLPRLASERQIAEATDNALMDVSDSPSSTPRHPGRAVTAPFLRTRPSSC